MSTLTDRQREASDIGRNLVVIAGAGSGKTKVLVERYIKVLTEDRSLGPRNILALTFTEKAASEMKAKVRLALLREAAGDEDRFEPMLTELESSDISTIHSFCTRLIRTEPLGLGLDPGFGVLTEARAATLLQESIGSVFRKDGPESSSLRRLIVDHGSSMIKRTLQEMVRDRSRTKYDPSSPDLREASLAYLERCFTVLRDRALSGYPAVLCAIEGLRGLPPPRSEDESTKLVASLIRVPEGDPDAALKALGSLLHRLLNDKNQRIGVARFGSAKTWGGSIAVMREHIKTIAEFASDNQHHLRYIEGPDLPSRARRSLEDLIEVLKAVDRNYSELKVRDSVMDFEDMVNLSLKVLRDDMEGLRTRLRDQYRHIMVDEFQDTDPRQWELVKLLWDKEAGSKLFLVGDPKQSIYGFRSSDVRLFTEASKRMHAEGTGDSVVLDLNFRSRSEIMDFVNGLFTFFMMEDSVWGVPFEALRSHKGGGGTLTFIGVEGKTDCDYREGIAVAKTIRRALREAWPVIDPGSGLERPLGISDIAVLFRGRTGLKHYERAFRAMGIPFVVYKGKGFYERQEISDLLRMLQWLCTPSDDVALASVLKGPFFYLTDEDLLRTCTSEGRTLMERLKADPEQRLTLERLERYLSLARIYPVHIALPRIIEDSDLYACLGGRRECRNLDRALEMLAGSEGRSIFEVRDELYELKEQKSREGEPPLSAEAAVSMMTIHAAKGLEWPLVFLIGMHHEGSGGGMPEVRMDPDGGVAMKVFDPSKGKMVQTPSFVLAGESIDEREAEEEKRLFYVACTRAKDHLVLSGRIPSPEDSTQKPPQGPLKLLMKPLGIDIGTFEKGSVEVGGVALKLDLVRSTQAEDEADLDKELEMVAETYPLAGPIGSGPVQDVVHPSGDRESRAYTPPPLGRSSTPDQFGTMVHEVLMGRDPRRVAVENGFPEEEKIVKDMAERIFSILPKEGIEAVFNEVSVLGREGDRPVVGRIDRLLKMMDGSYIVIDFKTGSRSESHGKQVRTYMDAVEWITGARVAGIIAYPDGSESVCRETTSKSI